MTIKSDQEPSSFVDGRFIVQRFLGQGGNKRVYLVNDTQLDRDVALALIKSEGLDEARRLRLQFEAKAMGRLGSNPHIVAVFDVGEEAGQPYFVTEFMGGGDLEALIGSTPRHQLPLAEVVRLTSEICVGLAFAHENGIVHRDLKPGNIWLTHDGTAKIGDFGLARAVDRARLTQSGLMVGTPSYMAPEQTAGHEVGPECDLYSLGATLYEMICGRPPFVSPDGDPAAIIHQHLQCQPDALTTYRLETPTELERLVLALLEKDPDKRPRSALDVRDALGRLTLDDSSHSISPPPERPLYSKTFVGRELESRELKLAFDRVSSGTCELIMIAGEPGIGKSALCRQLGSYVTLRGGTTLVGHCYEEESLARPYLAVADALQNYVLNTDLALLSAELGEVGPDVARIVPEVSRRLPVKRRPSGEPEEERWRLYQAIARFIASASSSAPIVLILEDLQWADSGTLGLLVHLVRTFARPDDRVRVLLVGTYRDADVDRSHPLSNTLAELRRVGDFSRITLRGLDAGQVQKMMSTLAADSVATSISNTVHQQTEGNPLFVQELMRYLVEEELVTTDQEQWRRTLSTSVMLAIPEGIRDVIGKRLSRLSSECNQALTIAGVIGRDFDLEILRAVAEMDDDVLTAALEEAVRVGVLEDHSGPGRLCYSFSHSLFSQALSHEMFAARRVRLHQKVGLALEAAHRETLDAHATELAEHFSWSTDGADLSKAIHYFSIGAQQALTVFDYVEAVRLLERALATEDALDKTDKSRRCDLLLLLASALGPAGEALRGADVPAEEAFLLAEEIGDDKRATQACRVALTALVRHGAASIWSSETRHRWIDRADKYAQADTNSRLVANGFLAMDAAVTGEICHGFALAHQTLEDARTLGNEEALADAAYVFLGGVACPPEMEEERRNVALEFATTPLTCTSSYSKSWLWRVCGDRALEWGRRDAAVQAWSRLDELAKRTHDPEALLNQRVAEILLAVCDGRLRVAAQSARSLLEEADEYGSSMFAQAFCHFAVPAFVMLGEFEPALELIGSDDRAFGIDEVPNAQLERLWVLSRAGRVESAGELLQSLWDEYRLGSDGLVAMADLVRLLDSAIALRDLDRARYLADQLSPARGLAWTRWGCPARLLGDEAVLGGERTEALAHYYRALDLLEEGYRPERALTHASIAELLACDPERHADANRHQDLALADLREMDMGPALHNLLRHRRRLEA